MIIVILFTDKRNWNNSIHEIRSWFSFRFSESSLGHEILREQRNVLSSFDDLVSTIVISDFPDCRAPEKLWLIQLYKV